MQRWIPDSRNSDLPRNCSRCRYGSRKGRPPLVNIHESLVLQAFIDNENLRAETPRFAITTMTPEVIVQASKVTTRKMNNVLDP